MPETPIVVKHLRTERLTLRPLQAADRAAYVRMMELSEDHLAPWSPAEDPRSTHASRFDRALAKCREGLSTGTACRLAGFLDDGAIAGLFNLNNIVRGVFQSADAGWLVSAACAGRGLGTEGVRALLDLAFAEDPQGGIGLHRVQAAIIPSNGASLRLAAKCGFRREGYARRYLKIAGRWQDHVLLARLAEEHLKTA